MNNLNQFLIYFKNRNYLIIILIFFIVTVLFFIYSRSIHENQNPLFNKQIKQAVQDVKIEVQTEKENFIQLMDQVEEMIDHVDLQKQKIQHLIEETQSSSEK